MAGRKQFDVDEALRRAMLVFWRWGYSEASVDRLAEGTGLGRGSLYGTFGDKSTLFRKASNGTRRPTSRCTTRPCPAPTRARAPLWPPSCKSP